MIYIFFHSLTSSASVAHLDSSQLQLSSLDFLLVAFALVPYLTSLEGSIRCSSAGSSVPFLTSFRSSLQRFGCSLFSVLSSDSCKVSLVFRIDKVVSENWMNQETKFNEPTLCSELNRSKALKQKRGKSNTHRTAVTLTVARLWWINAFSLYRF